VQVLAIAVGGAPGRGALADAQAATRQGGRPVARATQDVEHRFDDGRGLGQVGRGLSIFFTFLKM
jgi:hypothetical protein